jgi:hypothetical protein
VYALSLDDVHSARSYDPGFISSTRGYLSRDTETWGSLKPYAGNPILEILVLLDDLRLVTIKNRFRGF